MTESSAVKSIQCPECKDSKCHNMTVYDDGHGYCHKCSLRVSNLNLASNPYSRIIAPDYPENQVISNKEFIGSYEDITERGLSKQTCEFFGVMIGKYGKDDVYAYLYNNGVKIRYKNKKDFKWIEGKAGECNMLALDKYNDYDKPIILTEGVEDAMSCYECGYQATTIQSSGNVEKDIQRDYETLIKFKEIWLGFDNDEAGQEATKKALELLPSKYKVRVIDWGQFKDANEALRWGNRLDNTLENILKQEHQGYELEGIVLSDNLELNTIRTFKVDSLDIPLPKLSDSFGGFDHGCIYYLLAGSGVGKTTLLTWLGLKLMTRNPALGIAALYYEENEMVTPLRFTALRNNIPVGKLRRAPEMLSEEQWDKERQFFKDHKIAFLSKEAKRDSTNLFTYIEYLVNCQGYKMLLIDHMSYIIGCSEVGKNGERRDIDELAYKLRELTQKLNCIIIMISHINDPKGTKGWDEGEIPSLYSARGSRAIAQTADGIIGCARNMRNEFQQSVIDIYNLKNRWGGRLGKMDSLIYNDSTGNYGFGD